MKILVRLVLTLAGFALAFPATRAADAASQPKKKVLFFSKSSGFEHDAIKTDGAPRHGYAFRILTELGQRENIEFTFSKDGSLFTPQYLAQFDAFCFYTTGDLTLAKNDTKSGDGNLPLTAEGKQALLDAVAHGKGFLGLHSATDTFHNAENKDHGPARFRDDGDRADPYVKMLGGSFINHGKQQASHLIVADPKFPGIAALPANFGPEEEWYSLKDFASDLHVILLNDTAGMAGNDYARPSYPETWARMHGQGRVFYTSMGHREDVWTNPAFQSVLSGGLSWALRRVDADVTPNIAKVAPQANVLPKYVVAPPAPAKKAAPKTDAGKE